jgi:hypothetical protein
VKIFPLSRLMFTVNSSHCSKNVSICQQRSRYSDKLRAGRLGFDSLQEHDFSLLHSVQIGFEAHPASYSVGAGDDFPRGKAAGP